MPGFDLSRLPATEDEIDFSDIEQKYQVPIEEGFDNIVVVDNVPIVEESKREKLFKYLNKTFQSVGEIKEDGLHMPMSPDPKTGKMTSKGFIFIEFETPEQANLAVKRLDNYPMDKSHILKVNKFTDIERYSNVSEEYVEPEEEKYVEREHLRSWLMDPQARDQFVVYRGDDVYIYWNKKTEPPEEVYKRQYWTETYVQWSPLGTYLATSHRQGIALWGGPSWNKIIRFLHPGVKLIDFSPNERYLVTWSTEPITLPNDPAGSPFGPEDEGNQVIIWDVQSGQLLRSFPSVMSPEGAPKKITWPMFKWCPSDKYFARVTPGQQISVYETPSMGLVGKKSIKIDGVKDFEWQPASDKERKDEKGEKKPKEDIISYWTPEIVNQPARVTLLSIPSKEIVRTKNLFSVTDCKLHWQSNGDYLCVKVDRHTKTKKSTFTNIEIFHVREKDIPVEVLEVKDTVMAFAWEPKGDRFCIISTNDPSFGQPAQGNAAVRTAVSFYAIDRPKGVKGDRPVGNFRLIKTLDKKTSNMIFWSPRGRHVIFATMRSSANFDLEFWDLDFEGGPEQKEAAKQDPGASLQLMSTQEHYGVTDIEWDPTGRYVITSASMWRHMMENGYALWDFKGMQLQKFLIDKFKQLLWRPRPRSLLSSEQKKKLRKNLREYSKVFEEEDARAQSSVSKEILAHRKRLMDEWNAWRKRVEKEVVEERELAGLPPIIKHEEENEVVEEWVEEVVEEIEEIVED